MEISDADSIIVHGKCAVYIIDENIGHAEKISRQISDLNFDIVQFLARKDLLCTNPTLTNQLILPCKGFIYRR